MFPYPLEEPLRAALRALPIGKRVTTSIRLWRALWALRAADEYLAYLQDTMDCGAALGDFITGGKITATAYRVRYCEQCVADITEPLLGIERQDD